MFDVKFDFINNYVTLDLHEATSLLVPSINSLKRTGKKFSRLTTYTELTFFLTY